MKPVISRRNTCRLCSDSHLDLVLQLTPTPPANAFVPAERISEIQEAYPLNVFLCKACKHLQLLDVINPEILFRNYVYVSSTSPAFVEHFRKYAYELIDMVTPAKDALAVDIGSNDGTLLRFFKDRGMRVLGVDPALNIARKATESGIDTLPTFFSRDFAHRIREKYGLATIITANNVFAHIDDLADITDGIRDLLFPDGVFAFEVSYLGDVIEKTFFDTIYHEHLSYHSVKPLKLFFSRHGMKLIDIKRVPTHGGSLRGIVQLADGPRKASHFITKMINLEREMGLDRSETFKSFAANIDRVKFRLSKTLKDLKALGKTIAGYGAPAKATTLLYHFDLGGVLDFIVDDSTLKQNLFTPGYHIPVLPPEAIYQRKPDYLIILAWNFAQQIIEKHQSFLDKGGRFIIPLPEVEIK